MSVDARDVDDDELGAGFVSRRSIDRAVDGWIDGPME